MLRIVPSSFRERSDNLAGHMWVPGGNAAAARADIAGVRTVLSGVRTVLSGVRYGRMSVEKRAMQVETSLRLPAFAMQLSNLVKTLVLFATSVPTRTPKMTAMITARTPQAIPAPVCPGLVAPFVRPRVMAMTPRTMAIIPPMKPSGKKTKDKAATRLATPRTRAATPRPFLGRAVEGASGGCAGPEYSGVLVMPCPFLGCWQR